MTPSFSRPILLASLVAVLAVTYGYAQFGQQAAKLDTVQAGDVFRDSTARLRTGVHDLIVEKKTRDDIARMLQAEFHWVELHLARGLDGVIAENQ